MVWFFIVVAGVFEVTWAIGLKYAEGFSRFWPSVITLSALAVSMIFLAQAVRTLPIGTAYAIWTGIGAIGTATLGIILFGESRDLARLASILLIVAGIVGLRITSSD
jgi:quaternary ammonium compound-resistance protein SugE